ncbi:hypothetical protein PIROE2DRAFT_4312, partial [Piromyces sp. E2]
LNLEEKKLSIQVSNIYNKYEDEINFGNNNPWIIDRETEKPCHFLDITCLNKEFKKFCNEKYISFITLNMNEISKNRPNKKTIQNFLLIDKLNEEYMKSSNNRFTLLQERISNELNINKKEAKNLIDNYHEYLREKNIYKSNIKTFINHRNEMIDEITESIKNINENIKKSSMNEKNKEKQLELIEKLHTKLKIWRKEKILKLKEEEKIKNLKKLEILKIKKKEEKKKKLRKLKNQQKLIQYHQIIEEREQKRKMKEEEEKKLEDLKQIEISKYNQNRIDFRKKEYQNHLMEKIKKKEEEIKIKQLQELHLEKIRASVGISAEIDPERVKKPTISSMKSKSIYDKDNIFDVIGYTDKQIVKDKRMSFIPSGLLNDIKKLANIEKDGQVIAYATNNPVKKKREHKHEKKNKGTKKEIYKDESNINQLPSLNTKNNIIKNNIYNNNSNNENTNNIIKNNIYNDTENIKNNIIKNNNVYNDNENSKNNILKNNIYNDKENTKNSNIYNNNEAVISTDITKSSEVAKSNRNENNNLSIASSLSTENTNNIKSKSNIKVNDNNSISKEDTFFSNELKNNQISVNRTSSSMGKIKMKQTKTPVEASAFQYPVTKARVGHLQNINNKNNKLRQELAFLYDVPDNTSEIKEKSTTFDPVKENHLCSIVNDIIPKINVIPNNSTKNGLFDESKKIINGNDEISILTKSVIPKNLNPKELNFVSLKENNSNDV